MISLAAWRWLNGGDFVLCPPPELMMNCKSVEGKRGADLASRLIQEEDEEEDDDDVDEAVRMILNGTCDNLQLPQPRRQEHTELISEM